MNFEIEYYWSRKESSHSLVLKGFEPMVCFPLSKPLASLNQKGDCAFSPVDFTVTVTMAREDFHKFLPTARAL